ncbi:MULTISPECIES: hypothetical protein [Agrobacterium]|uniref:Uncharacterized protein n=1 Tax=Agrobacterium tumefaciens TaxID=358 RepID=A0AAE6BBZ7_AGRTU|nr:MULTISPECIES: hypothetical protein [Agrobacterium]QCL72724.1 hypothetical protein CFBP5499_04300 [Agrobacterium tumefaciens]QCL78299.1 hypothetical protein CFBP5877_03860 [Agrobacterium tumefaciens]
MERADVTVLEAGFISVLIRVLRGIEADGLQTLRPRLILWRRGKADTHASNRFFGQFRMTGSCWDFGDRTNLTQVNQPEFSLSI